ncbi:ABC transporter [Streptomyces sp. NPDC047043]|uniref:ABC transporter n=1 Tax=Streptomyces sp. NPDC047043 TaxID=3154497 RepID=UPI0033F24CBF
MIRELTPPVCRTLPWRALAVGSGLGLLLAAMPRLSDSVLAGWSPLTLLRTAAIAHALSLTFLLDDPARHTTAAVPTRRALRTGIRLGLVVPLTALWWTAALLLVPSEARPPALGVTLEAAATCALALAAGTAAIRLTDEPRPGPSVAAALLFTAIMAPLLLPERWQLFVWPEDERWDAVHERWAWLLVGAVAALALCLPEPVRRFQPLRRLRVTSPSGTSGPSRTS